MEDIRNKLDKIEKSIFLREEKTDSFLILDEFIFLKNQILSIYGKYKSGKSLLCKKLIEKYTNKYKICYIDLDFKFNEYINNLIVIKDNKKETIEKVLKLNVFDIIIIDSISSLLDENISYYRYKKNLKEILSFYKKGLLIIVDQKREFFKSINFSGTQLSLYSDSIIEIERINKKYPLICNLHILKDKTLLLQNREIVL